MAGQWSDAEIAATLNRMGIRSGMGNTWTGSVVQSARARHRIRGVRSDTMQEAWLTMSQAAAKLGVSSHVIRRLIKDGVLVAEQAVPQAPWRIRASAIKDRVPPCGVRAWRRLRYPACWAGTLRLPRRAA